MVHRLHDHTSPSRWVSWVWGVADGRALGVGNSYLLAGEHGRALRRLLPLYRFVSRVIVGDGRRTSFWMDSWHPCGAVSAAFPALYTHTMDAEATVWQVRAGGLDSLLVPRLTAAGVRDRSALLALIDGALAGR